MFKKNIFCKLVELKYIFQRVLRSSRPTARKAVFLITDGWSNAGDPVPVAQQLQANDVEMFTFGIRQGNPEELTAMASHPAEEHTYILDSFDEFESLARRALHEGVLHCVDFEHDTREGR